MRILKVAGIFFDDFSRFDDYQDLKRILKKHSEKGKKDDKGFHHDLKRINMQALVGLEKLIFYYFKKL